jgi:hypothetical protein
MVAALPCGLTDVPVPVAVAALTRPLVAVGAIVFVGAVVDVSDADTVGAGISAVTSGVTSVVTVVGSAVGSGVGSTCPADSGVTSVATADTSVGIDVAGTSVGTSVAGTSVGTAVAGTSVGTAVAGTSVGTSVGTTTGAGQPSAVPPPFSNGHASTSSRTPSPSSSWLQGSPTPS